MNITIDFTYYIKICALINLVYFYISNRRGKSLVYNLKITSSTNENKLVVIKYSPKATGALKVINPLITVSNQISSPFRIHFFKQKKSIPAISKCSLFI